MNIGWIQSLKLGTHCLGSVISCYIKLYKTDKLANLFSTPELSAIRTLPLSFLYAIFLSLPERSLFCMRVPRSRILHYRGPYEKKSVSGVFQFCHSCYPAAVFRLKQSRQNFNLVPLDSSDPLDIVQDHTYGSAEHFENDVLGLISMLSAGLNFSHLPRVTIGMISPRTSASASE